MIPNTELSSFLVAAKKNPYSAGEAAIKTTLDDSSIEITYRENSLFYRDRYFDVEPFSGAETVFENGRPLWTMNFYGCVNEKSLDLSEGIYIFLRKCLAQADPSIPFRGPLEYIDSEYTYINSILGTIDHFVGRESIICNKEEVYHANYHGGLLNRVQQ